MAIQPSDKCPECNGLGVINTVDKRSVTCICILKQQAIEYLTPVYANSKYIKDINVTPLLGKNIIIDSDPQSLFKAVIKSFLLNTAMKYSHRTQTAFDVLQAYLTNSESHLFDEISNVDILILYLVADPQNRSYGDILISLIEKRNLLGKVTWIYSSSPFNSDVFYQKYSEIFSKFIGGKFTHLTKLSNQFKL